MSKFFRRVFPAKRAAFLLPLLLLVVGCATAPTEPAAPTVPGIAGAWSPPAALVRVFEQNRGGVTRAVFSEDGNTLVVTWAGASAPVTMTRSSLRLVGAGAGERWVGNLTLDDGSPAQYTITCPTEPTGPRMQCRGVVVGPNRTHDNPLPLIRRNS